MQRTPMCRLRVMFCFVAAVLCGFRLASAQGAAKPNIVIILRMDPYERADITSNIYYDWVMEHAFTFVPAQAYVGDFLTTFKDYPQRQKAASGNLDEVLEKMKQSGSH